VSWWLVVVRRELHACDVKWAAVLPRLGAPTEIAFPPFRLDLRNEQLFDGGHPVPLRPKTYAVLRFLIERRGQLVTKNEIMDAVWPATAVSDSVLKVCVREIREALRDDPERPRYVETAHRRGYRFIAIAEPAPPFPSQAPGAGPAALLAGRAQELASLEADLVRTVNGRRVIRFVTGEPGIGKTALVEALMVSAARHAPLLVSRGQCVEHYGASEAYLPILEAFSHVCNRTGNGRVVRTLARYAPTWLAQMPAVVADQRALEGAPPAGSPLRMLREMADAIEAMTADTPLLLLLEDLHWSDPSTINLISYLARRREPARLMIVGTYRPAEASAEGHPLRGGVQELLAHRACEEQRLAHLDQRAIGEYLDRRFPGHGGPDLARTLHRHTAGNPLFLVSVVDYLVDRGALNDASAGSLSLPEELPVPATVRGVIDRQIDLLEPPDRDALEVAGVAGQQFTVAEVAAAMGAAETAIEAGFERLARQQQFLHREPPVELPDGTLTTRFGFVHALHHNALYERVPLARRTQLHRSVGEWLEGRFGGRLGELAPALAMHFEQGRDHRRAVRYCRIASETAQQRFATSEAIRLATHGLTLLDKTWPEGPDRDREELALRLALGVPLAAACGFAAPQVEHTYHRALDLSHHLDEPSVTFPIVAGLYVFYLIRADLAIARQLSRQLLEQATAAGDPEMLVHARWSALVTALNQGDFAAARDHFEAALPLCGGVRTSAYLTRFGQDAEIACRTFGAWTHWSLGDVQRARDELQAAHERATLLAHAHSRCFSHFFAAFIAQMQRQPAEALEHATLTQQLARDHGFSQWLAFGTILRGWARAMTGEPADGIAELEEGLAAYQRMGAAISVPHFMALHAEALAASAHLNQALARAVEGIAEARRTGGRYYESELLRLEAEIRLARRATGDKPLARVRLQEAADTARQQRAAVFERRAQQDLSALPRR
jgi:DNA-binding winged helix-turn-helix (wHTH) protein/predicted ATPase